MAFEIEKKFVVTDYGVTKSLLDKNYGKFKRDVKAGYWWTEVTDPSAPLLELKPLGIKKKNIEVINSIAEIKIPEQDFQFARIRVKNNNIFVLAVKNKSLQNGIEQNVEYEYELDKQTIEELINFFSQNFYIYYYNVKETLLYVSGDASIELSNFNDLSNAYVEVEVVGDDQKYLNQKLEDFLREFDKFPIKEETMSYNQLSKVENAAILKNKKIRDYSKDAFKKLESSLS